MSKQSVMTLLGFIIPPCLAWLGGFDFNVRGPEAFFTAVAALICAGGIYFYPGWKP